jgi:ParB family transcriptional regulator, chromosome partitioning protein
MDLRVLKLDDIYVDDDLNSRGPIIPMDVVSLAKDIELHGLHFPVVVRKLMDNQRAKNGGKNFGLVAGYCRFMAHRILEKTEIHALVRSPMSDVEARILNFTENLMRKDLNILQEAKGLEKLRQCGMTEGEVSKQLGQSRGWVQTRYELLDLPPEIQKEAAAGFIKQYQIRQLHGLPREKQYEAVRIIKDRKIRGDNKPVYLKKPENLSATKARDRYGIFKMMSHIQDVVGNNFGTRCLSWAAGEISSGDLYEDIKEIADEKGIDYEIPKQESEEEIKV